MTSIFDYCANCGERHTEATIAFAKLIGASTALCKKCTIIEKAKRGIPDDRTETMQFDITDADLGRHVRRKSTGEIGIVSQDPGNGWLHPGVVYEWKGHRHDLEYVTVIPDGPNPVWIVAEQMPSKPRGWYWAEYPGSWEFYSPELNATQSTVHGDTNWHTLISKRYWGPWAVDDLTEIMRLRSHIASLHHIPLRYRDRPPGFVAARRQICDSPDICFEFSDSAPVCGPCDTAAVKAIYSQNTDGSDGINR